MKVTSGHEIQWYSIRHVRLFNQQHPQSGIPTSDVFYEVIVNKNMLTQVGKTINALETCDQRAIN
jgi:hypothetical protein